MSTASFYNYELPSHLIAQEPTPQRDGSRLLVVDRATQETGHFLFRDLPDLLAAGDLLVLNDTRVVPARLRGRRAKTGGQWEGLYLHTNPEGLWELLCQTRGRLTEGETILVEPGPLSLTLVRKTAEGHWLVRPGESGPALDLLRRHGQVPLPPYIRKGRAGPADQQRYQTVYARPEGSVAAPTAGLHFSLPLLEQLEARGIRRTFLTLHVGLGTFAPIQVENVAQHHMHREWGELSQDCAAAIVNCQERGGRVIAVGTTSVRLLESVAASGPIRPWAGETDLFIYPPYSFRVVNVLVTNFHLPRTSLLCLVSAFGGAELIRRAYQEAIKQEYRFYSYGDSMLIV